MKLAIAIRHLPFEDLGTFAPVLAGQGYAVRYLEAGLADMTPAADADLLIVLGGPISANDEADYPFLLDEMAVLADRLKRGRPVLGICLGAQLIARVLGARVYPNKRKEIGWSPLRLSPGGLRSCLSELAPESEPEAEPENILEALQVKVPPLVDDTIPVLHWHGDTFDMPKEAVHLASTDICRNQAFSWGSACLALQFHPEVTGRGLERWLIGHAAEINATNGLSVAALRKAISAHAQTLEQRGPRCLEAWLRSLEP